MNAAVDMRGLEIRDELQLLRDRMLIAHEQRDYWNGKNPDEYEFWDGRISALDVEMKILQSQLRLAVIPGDGGPDEQRRLEAREDAKREYDSYE